MILPLHFFRALRTLFLWPPCIILYLLLADYLVALAQSPSDMQAWPGKQAPQKNDLPVSDKADIPQSATLLAVNYNYEIPMADLAARFGHSSRIGAALMRRSKNNFTYGIEAQYLFGSRVKEDSLLQNLFTPEGNLVGTSGYNANIQFSQQGLSIGVNIGKIFPLKTTKPNNGIWLNLTTGYLLHKIGFRDRQNDMPQLSGAYQKGYDRLSGGIATSIYVGYFYLADNKRINFHIGPIFTFATTRSIRKYNYDTQTGDTKTRKDLLLGIKLGWMLPFYDKNTISKVKKYYTN